MIFSRRAARFLLPVFWLAALTLPVRPEAMVQYFNTSYVELIEKIPELAEVGYNSIWLPPPTKGSGGLSVGYDLWDRFDLGGKDQRGTVRTRYGTEEELHRLIEKAHRFGIRIYFDTIMNHNAFDVPGYNEFTPIDVYPGFVPEDFHLRKTEDGFYRKWDNTRDWNDAWQVQHLGLSDLIDIAHEDWNQNFGASEGSSHPKYRGVRHPNNPEYYCYHPTLGYVGFNSTNITAQVIADNPEFYKEDVNAMLIRSVRWLIDVTKADGLRLDAVKHVPAYFFGQQSGSGKNESNAGYLGGAQEQFNLTRGYNDPNHRDSVFDTERPRDDAMMFGEHLGQPPSFSGYIDAGMRLVDNDLRSWLNDRLGSPFNGINGLDNAGTGGFPPGQAVLHAQSHDSDYAARRELQHATYFTRAGLPLIYTDGNYQAETLGESGGAFPRHANTAFLGQFNDPRVPNLVYIHNQFARGDQASSFSDGDYIAYERLDYREGHATDAEKVTMLFMMNDNYASGQSRAVFTRFPKDGGTANDAYLVNYSTYGGPFPVYASQLSSVVVPPGGYFVFSYRTPEEATGWKTAGGAPISLYQDGELVLDKVLHARRDGSDGDPAYNPRGLPDSDPTDFTYYLPVPRVSSVTNLSFVVRADGSAKSMLLRLNGGMDLNGVNHFDGDPRDHPPVWSNDTFLGYERMSFGQRIHREKFAAQVSNTGATNRSTIFSPGAESWEFIAGDAGVNTFTGVVAQVTGAFTAQWVYHNPNMSDAPGAVPQLGAPQDADANPTDIWLKVGLLAPSDVTRAFIYYTTDESFPEGAGGDGTGTTRTVEMFYQSTEGGGDWWKGSLPVFAPGTRVRYKLGIFRGTFETDETAIADNELKDVFPTGADTVARKRDMLTVFRIDGFNGETAVYRPHNDFGDTETGLKEGFHFLSARVFLDRSSPDTPFPGTSLYNTFKQTFYYDAEVPGGEIKFPQPGNTLGGQEYEGVIRTDLTVKEVWVHIADSNPNNDDGITGYDYGNGANSNAVPAWVKATPVSPTAAIASEYPQEWRFKYRNIPASGTATITARLLEISSSTNHLLAAAAAHVGELSVFVNTAGPAFQFRFDWPWQDGTQVNLGWTSRVLFSSGLGDNYNDAQLRDSFSYQIRRVGSATGVFQPKDDFVITRNRGDGLGVLEFDLPNLWDESAPSDQTYELLVSQTASGGLLSETSVRVRPTRIEPPPFIDIVEPEEVDVIGNRQDIEVSLFPTNQPVVVHTGPEASNVWVEVTGIPGPLPFATTNEPVLVGSNRLTWTFVWAISNAGVYRITAFLDDDGDPGTAEAQDLITMTVRQVTRVPSNPNDQDDDDDGMHDFDERNPAPALTGNPETWSNEQVHDEWAFGRTDPLRADSDGDGLSDGLELGYRVARIPAETDLMADTDGDGFKNFQPDLDPPFFNTLGGTSNLGRVPDVTSASQGGNRKQRMAGTVTDANNPDTDYDGIPDGIEDANRNGWIDGDGELLPADWQPWLGRDWPDGVRQSGETWMETDPNNADTDGDGLSDGYGEDTDFDGRIAGDSNSNRVYNAGEAWGETDPLSADTDGDGLPDGWEVRYAFDALDNGLDSFRTATADDGDPVNGPDGNPDGDTILVSGNPVPYTNLMEYNNGTDPRQANVGGAAPIGSITIGPGALLGTVNGQPMYEEFQDWTVEDLLALDEYEGDGPNYQSGDVFPAFDGFDSSRDLVAFYVRDGGDVGNGGDGRMYFRADFHDLQPFAEEGQMDLYVAVNLGQYGSGEKNLPDDVDTLTAMGWRAVVAVYDSRNGRVYVDSQPTNDSSNFGQDLSAFGVFVRDQNHSEGFLGAYFNSQLDAVEFAISRQALTAAGWNGINVDDLRFHVYTTKQGTSNSPPGAGDLGGRSDIRDTIYDDKLAEDYWKDQSFLDHTLRTGISRSGNHDRGKRAKVAMLVHGNQAIQPASVMHDLINNGQGAGYHRVLDPHEVFVQPLNLHVTATLASALQWASVDPAANKPWKDGPAFNARIGALASTGLVELVASTFSDNILPYFTPDFIADNVALANGLLAEIYGVAPSSRVFWTPERVVDNDVLRKVRDLGYTHTFIDQMRHVLQWYGRTSALTDDGYRIQRVSPGGGGDVNAFVLNDQASTFRFDSHDQGLGFALRRLFNKKARSGLHDQVVILFYNWEEFGDKAKADAYDRMVRWMANQPWIELVSLDDVAAGNVDLSYPPDGTGDAWAPLFRGFNAALNDKASHDYIDHATAGNYDNWYLGSALEEGLNGKVFQHRPGQNVPQPYGMLYGTGIIADAWDQVKNIQHPGLRELARGTLHASVFQTAFHNQANNNLSKFSTGEYVWPDNAFENLADFAAIAQSRSRTAALYAALDEWAQSGTNGVGVVSVDVDLDGENETLLTNDRVAALFERLGGRLTGFWLRYPLSGRVYQLVGPYSSYAGRATEEEGIANVLGGQVDARLTSGLKDWYADLGGSGQSYVNDLYSVVLHANGLTLTSGDGKIAKTVSLGAGDTALQVTYSLHASIQTLFLRHGFSPGLRQLWGRGQASLGSLLQNGNRVSLSHFLGEGRVELGVDLLSNVVWNPLASDRDPAELLVIDAPLMRNQAHTHQVELSGTGPTFQFTLGGGLLDADSDEDGLPDEFELVHEDLDPLDPADAGVDADDDGADNTDEFVAGTDPGSPSDRPEVQQVFPNASGSGFEIFIPTKSGRQYRLFYQDVLDGNPTAWTPIAISPIQGDGSVKSYLDDGTHTDPAPDSPLLNQRFYYLLIDKL